MAGIDENLADQHHENVQAAQAHAPVDPALPAAQPAALPAQLELDDFYMRDLLPRARRTHKD